MTLTPYHDPCLHAHDASFHHDQSRPFQGPLSPLPRGILKILSQGNQSLHPGHPVCSYLQRSCRNTLKTVTLSQNPENINNGFKKKKKEFTQRETSLTVVVRLAVTGWSTLLTELAGWRLSIGTSSLRRISRGSLLLLLALLLVSLLLAIACLLSLVAWLLLAICCGLGVAILVVTSWLAVSIVTDGNRAKKKHQKNI